MKHPGSATLFVHTQYKVDGKKKARGKLSVVATNKIFTNINIAHDTGLMLKMWINTYYSMMPCFSQ
jgi:hypothetical protein